MDCMLTLGPCNFSDIAASGPGEKLGSSRKAPDEKGASYERGRGNKWTVCSCRAAARILTRRVRTRVEKRALWREHRRVSQRREWVKYRLRIDYGLEKCDER